MTNVHRKSFPIEDMSKKRRIVQNLKIYVTSFMDCSLQNFLTIYVETFLVYGLYVSVKIKLYYSIQKIHLTYAVVKMHITLSFQALSTGAKLLVPMVGTLKKRAEKFISTLKFRSLITRSKKVADPSSRFYGFLFRDNL